MNSEDETELRRYVHAQLEVLRDPTLRPCDKLTMLAIAMHAETALQAFDVPPFAYVSLSQLSRCVGASRASIRRAIRNLQAARYISSHRRDGFCTCYHLLKRELAPPLDQG